MHLKECVVFLDDILVYSSSLEEHLGRLENVFRRLKECGLKLKPSKCEFLKSECQYLGHVVSAEGIKTDPEKIDKVVNWKVPSTAKELASFLGFAGFYRRYVEKFSLIARPLQNLLKSSDGKSPLVWCSEAEQSFQTLKFKLTSAPILAYADYSKPFILHVDASGIGLGAVLYQIQDNKRRVIAYASRGLNAAEHNYPAHKREFLALKWAVVDKFHDYLYGNKCEVYTDSNPLTYVLSSAKLDATGHRWLAQLSSYDFSLHYKPGPSHVDADALSRLDNNVSKAICSSLQVESGFCHTLPLGVGFENDILGTQVASAVFDGDAGLRQEEDPILGKVKIYVKEDLRLSGVEWRNADPELRKLLSQREKLKIVNDILYRCRQGDQGEVLQYLVPQAYRSAMFRSLHDSMGHPGRDKTLVLHSERCYWPSMTKDVESMVRKCRRCVCRKARTETAPLTPIITSQPLELVCLDYLLVEPSAGYEHLLVITDHFTKFAKVIPTRNETALTTARALYDNFITVYGAPQRLHSDQGRCFESKVIKELCVLTGMKKSRTTPYHPMGNGACERMNQSVLKLIGTLANDQKSKWKSYLPSLIHAYNCTPHAATGFSPYELMFGRKPMLPVDAEIKPKPNGDGDLTKFVFELKKQVEYVNSIAKKRMEQKAVSSKELYDKRSVDATLQVGDTVLVRKTAIYGREKCGDKWLEEVYVVISHPNPEVAVYTVKPLSGGGRMKTLHRNLLLPISCDSGSTQELAESSSKPNKRAQRKVSHFEVESCRGSDSSDSEEEIFVSPLLFPAAPAVSVGPSPASPAVPAVSIAGRAPTSPVVSVSSPTATPAVTAVPQAQPVQLELNSPQQAVRRSSRSNFGVLPKRFGDFIMSRVVRY